MKNITHLCPLMDVRIPFAVTSDAHLRLQEEVLQLQFDYSLKLKFNELKLFQYWSFIKTEYLIIKKKTINTLLQLSTTYFCELGFSILK